MPIAERLAARATVSLAPVGTSISDTAAWKQIGWTDGSDFIIRDADLKPYLDTINRSIANMKRAADGYSIKQGTWMTGDGGGWVDKKALDLYYGNIPQRYVVGIDPAAWDASIINERSKPMGLTKEHEHTTDDGRKLTIEQSMDDPRSVYINVHNGRQAAGIWLNAADQVPVALNVLGYDRPDLERGACGAQAGGYFAMGEVIWNEAERDELLAKAVANLRSIDYYDQARAKRKADEEAAEKAARVEVANREIAERFLRKARNAYSDAVIEAYEADVTPESAAKLQAALSSYETARRKFEGLPN